MVLGTGRTRDDMVRSVEPGSHDDMVYDFPPQYTCNSSHSSYGKAFASI